MPTQRAKDSVRWLLGERRAKTALLLSLLLGSSPARAAVQEIGGIAATSRQVEIHVTGSPEAVEKTKQTLNELFGRLDVTPTVISSEDDEQPGVKAPLAIAYIDFSPPHATVVILDGATGDEVDRREFPEEDTLETSVEASAHVVYLVVEAMLTRERDEASRPAARAQPAAPPRAPATKPSAAPATPVDHAAPPAPQRRGAVAVDAGVSVGVTRLAPAWVRPGGGIAFEVASVRRGFGASLYATTYAPSEIQYGSASAFARVSSLRTLLTQDLALSHDFAVALAVGGGVEWLHLEPESAPLGVQVKARSLFSPLVASLAGVRVRLTERAFLSAWAGVDFDLSNERLVAEVEGERQLVLALSGMRPTLMLMASTPLASDTRFGRVEQP